MATYQKDVTQNLTPATADVSPLIQGKRMAYEAQVATAKADAQMYEGVANLAGTAFKGYQEYQQGAVEQQARALQTEFFERNQAASRLNALEAVRPAAGGAIAEGMLGGNVDAAKAQLKGFEDEVALLKQAAQGGMSNMEYVTRIDSLTKDAIAKYPGSSDVIREIIGKETGMASADRWAQEQFVKDRFSTAGTGGASAIEKAKADDIKGAASVGMFGSAAELTQLSQSDPAEFDKRIRAYQGFLSVKSETEALKASTTADALGAERDSNVARVRFPALVSAIVKENLFTDAVLDTEKVYADTLALAASGKNPIDNPEAFKTQLQIHSARMISGINSARLAAHEQLTAYIGTQTSLKYEIQQQMRKEIDDTADRYQKQFESSNAGSLVAMAGIMSDFKDKSTAELMAQLDLATKQIGLMPSPLVAAYWAGSAPRKKLEKSHPELYKHLAAQDVRMTSLNAALRDPVSATQDLVNLTNAVNVATSKGEAIVPTDTVTPETARPAHELVMGNAMAALQKSELTPVDQNSMKSALRSAVEVGATSKTLAKDYKRIGEALNTKLSPQELAVIKEGVSDSSGVGMRTVTDLKRVLEDKYGVTLQLGVNSMGEISVITPPQERVMTTEQYKLMGAAKEFTSRAKPILNNLVYGRAAVTQEEPSVVGTEVLDVINNNTPYNGFFDLKPKAPDRGLITDEPPPTEFDTKLEEKLSEMKKADPLLNIDYVRNAVMKAPADQRESLKKAMGLA